MMTSDSLISAACQIDLKAALPAPLPGVELALVLLYDSCAPKCKV